MDQGPLGKFLGLTKNELRIFLPMSGLFGCVVMLFASYVLYTSVRAVPASATPTFPALEMPSTPTVYQPAPVLLTGWPPWTPGTAGPTKAPTRTPRPTATPSRTKTPSPTRTPTATATPTLTKTVAPTATIQFGTSGHPIPIGSGFVFPDFGILTVTNSSWSPGQTGLAIVNLNFVCTRPAGARCATNKLILDALGGSGIGYERVFDPGVPQPSFGYYLGAGLYGGETENGTAGFLIKNAESTLVMRVQIFLEGGEFFFRIGPIL